MNIIFTLMLACKKQQPPEPVVEPPPQNISAVPSQLPEQIITMTQNFQRVYFDTDSSTLNSQAKEALEENAQLMLKHTDIQLRYKVMQMNEARQIITWHWDNNVLQVFQNIWLTSVFLQIVFV